MIDDDDVLPQNSVSPPLTHSQQQHIGLVRLSSSHIVLQEATLSIVFHIIFFVVIFHHYGDHVIFIITIITLIVKHSI